MHNETTPAPRGETCSGCRFFLSYTRTNTNVYVCSCGKTHEATSGVRVHHCRRFPHPESCELNGWCGEFQPIEGSYSVAASNESGAPGGQDETKRQCSSCKYAGCPDTHTPCSECFEEWPQHPKWEPKRQGGAAWQQGR